MQSNRIVRGLSAVLASIAWAIPTAAAQGQVRFAWPEQTPDIGAYGTVEDCLGVIRKLEVLAARARPRTDTLPVREVRPANALPPEISAAARQCGAGVRFDQLFARETLYVREMDNAYTLLLYAGRTGEARAFGDRWLASIPASDDTLRAVVLATLATRDAQARPANFASAWVNAQQINVEKLWRLGFRTLGVIWENAMEMGDTLTTGRIARVMTSTAARLPDSVTQSVEWQHPTFGIGKQVLAVIQNQKMTERLDSIRVSTQGYLRYQATLRAAAKLNPDDGPRQAQPIVGDSWFPQKPPGPRPTPGVVSVVLTTDNNDCRPFCLGPIALVRRLKDRFPAVEFTFLANTKGYHGLVIEPPTLEQEAVLIDSVYRKVHGLPAITVIHHTRFWRLPDPDRRRINEPSPNRDTYGDEMRMALVDKAGTIVSVMLWGQRFEAEFAALIEAVLQQPE